MINKIHDIVLSDLKVKVREIAEVIFISTKRVVNILHTHLCIRKLCARWIHHYTPESHEGSKQSTKPGESAPKRPKTQ